MSTLYDVVIIGAGPGGLQAAIAAASEGLVVLVLEAGKVGGQIGQTPLLENSVFSAGGITGPAFAESMHKQALAMGATIVAGRAIGITEVRGANPHWRVAYNVPTGGSKQAHTHTVIIAVGNRWRELDIPGAKELVGRKVHLGPARSIGYNATGRDVAVYGGGPAAGQAILALAAEVNTRRVRVYMRTKLRMPLYLSDRIREAEKAGRVTIHEDTQITKFHLGLEDQLHVHVQGNRAQRWIDVVDAVFMCNGLQPATEWLEKGPVKLNGVGQIECDGVAAILVRKDLVKGGIYAIGDCRAGSTARVGVAIGDGSQAITEIWRYFLKMENPPCARCVEALR